jgi:hypothetical protein
VRDQTDQEHRRARAKKMRVCGKHSRVDALASVFAFMHTVYDLVPSLAAALNIGHSQSHNLSPAAAKLRNRFKDLVGFDRGIIHELGQLWSPCTWDTLW